MAHIAINGFGRIGRLFLRKALAEESLDVKVINDLGDLENLAYLFKYDTVYGRYAGTVHTKPGALVVNEKEIKVLREKDPAALPWKEMGIDIVVEATGIFESFEKAKVHLTSGARRVILTAPAKDDDSAEARTILMGINQGELQAVKLSSNASCTTNAASPIIQILSENPGIEKAILNTVHGYTATQNLTDGSTKGKDFRRGRAAAQNIAPSTTGAAIAVTRVISELKGKFDGVAIRVPVVTGSIADITFMAKRNVTVEEINDILRKAAAEPRWQGIFMVSEDQLVSSDIIGEPYTAIADLTFTKVVDGNLVKIFSWYDNEAGYVATLVKHVLVAAEFLFF